MLLVNCADSVVKSIYYRAQTLRVHDAVLVGWKAGQLTRASEFWAVVLISIVSMEENPHK